MGLLTDPSVERSRIPELLDRYHRPIVVVLYITGVVWFLALAHNSLNHGTYFSENALLPGLVQGDFYSDSSANQYLDALKEEAETHRTSMPYAWLTAQFRQLGLDTFAHNFTLHYPMDESKAFTGKNVYGILRAVRGSSTEGIVISVPYRPPSSPFQDTMASVALMFALARFSREQVYWAKDLIFLITEHEQLGAQAWLQAYHQTEITPRVLDYGDLQGRAGSIQAAINLEIHSAQVSHIDVKVEGLNGQLPNLDLVNLIHRLCHRENVHHTFKNRNDHPQPDSFHGWLHQLTTLSAMVASQATGVPTGNHGLYHRFGISAVTLVGVREEGRVRRMVGFLQLGRVLEGVCRSLNNLLERFHQSFFFYLLPSTNRYISIGVYMPPFGLIAGAILVKALALWHATNVAMECQEKSEKEGKEKSAKECPENSANESKGKNTVEYKAKNDLTKISASNTSVDYSLLGCLPAVLIPHLLAALVTCCPQWVASLGSQLSLSAEDSVFMGLLSLALAILVVPFTTLKSPSVLQSSWRVLLCIACLELTTLLSAASVYNFSLAFIVAVFYAPVVLIVAASSKSCVRLTKSFLLLLIHPLTLMFLFVLLDSWSHFPDVSLLSLLHKTVNAGKHALMFSIVDSFVYANWVFPTATCCLLPVWQILWHVVWQDVQPIVV